MVRSLVACFDDDDDDDDDGDDDWKKLDKRQDSSGHSSSSIGDGEGDKAEDKGGVMNVLPSSLSK